MDKIFIYLIGTAGCGKSTATSAIRNWLDRIRIDVVTLNLDPGVEALPYNPDIDIREFVKIREVMEEYGLGPNGAQIVAADMAALNIKKIADILEGFDCDYVLVDTPGQIELFAYRSASNVIINRLDPERSMMLFLFDPQLVKTPAGFVSNMMLAAGTHFKLAIPTQNLLAKSDTVSEEEIAQILSWSMDFENLYDSFMQAKVTLGGELNLSLLKALSDIDVYKEMLPFSSENDLGIEDIYNTVQQLFMGGEDLMQD